MQILRPLSTGELFDQIFTLYRKNFLLFFVIAFVPGLIEAALTSTALLSENPQAESFQVIGVILLAKFVGFCATAISQGATAYAVSELYLDRPVSPVSAYAYVRPLWLKLIVLQVGYSLYVGLGFLLLIVPGIYWAISFSLATSATAIESLGFGEAMSRSKYLVDNNRWRVVMIFLLSLVVSLGIAFALGYPGGLVTEALKKVSFDASFLFEQLLDAVVMGLAAPIALIGLTLVYYDARVRKEAFDLHHLIDTQLSAGSATATS